MKKLIFLFLNVIMISTILTGCGDNKPANTTSEDNFESESITSQDAAENLTSVESVAQDEPQVTEKAMSLESLRQYTRDIIVEFLDLEMVLLW